MKKVLFSPHSNKVRATLLIKGSALVVYSMRLWHRNDSQMQLIKELRGSCFNEFTDGFWVDVSESKDYFVELGANINTTMSETDFSIVIRFTQQGEEGNETHLGDVVTEGKIGYEDGGKYKAMGAALIGRESGSLKISAA